jgi:hypothetical protein
MLPEAGRNVNGKCSPSEGIASYLEIPLGSVRAAIAYLAGRAAAATTTRACTRMVSIPSAPF